MKWIAIVAMSENRVIGQNVQIPWHIPGEQKRFKNFTTGHTIVMGRKTWDSLPRKPLPNRLNIILSRALDPATVAGHPSVMVMRSVDDLPSPTLDSQDHGQLFIIGGSEIYAQTLHLCQEILLTRVFGEYPGDAYFPAFEDQFTLQEVITEEPDYRIERWKRLPL